MKKKISIALVALLAFMLVGLTGCDSRLSTEAQKLKDLFGSIASLNINDLSRSMEANFRQKYSVDTKTDSDNGSEEFHYAYEGEGEVTLSFELKDLKLSENELEVADLIENGKGFFEGCQHEKFEISSTETSKVFKDEETDSRNDIVDANHDFLVMVDDDNYYAYSDKDFSFENDPDKNTKESFAGQVSRDALLSNISRKAVNDSLEQILFMDSWKYIDELSRYTNTLFTSIDFDDIKAVNKLVADNEIKVEDLGETATIDFALDAEEFLSKILGDDEDEYAKIYGTVEIDKTTGDVIYYSYDLKDFFLAVISSENAKGEEGETKEVNAVVDEYIVEGTILNSTLDGPSSDHDFSTIELITYDSTTVEKFFEDYQKHFEPLS